MEEVYKQQNFKGSGSFGIVLEVADGSGKRLALKVLKQLNVSERDLKEAELLQQLSHVNIVKVFRSGFAYEVKGGEWVLRSKKLGQAPFGILMELCDGDLDSVLGKAGRKIDHTWNLSLFKQLLQGVMYLHANNIIHRDLKPANILLYGSVAKLADFGLAKGGVFSADAIHSLCGTPLYMAPEVREGEPYNKSVDVYSLGVILVELYCLREDFYAWIFKLPGKKLEYSTPLLKKHELPVSLGRLVGPMTQEPASRPSCAQILQQL